MVLDGMEQVIYNATGVTTRDNGWQHINKHKIHMVRYADDFIITGSSKEILENTVLPVIRQFLENRGLQLSEEKTRITSIHEGFNFLGQNVRKYENGKLLIKPSKDSFNSITTRIKEVVRKNRATSPDRLIQQLNPIIRGWCNYHRHICVNKHFSKLDMRAWNTLWRWAVKRHPNKGGVWIKNKYFRSDATSNWVFSGMDKGGKSYNLVKACQIKVIRHRLINGNANPYDPDWDKYFYTRRMLREAKIPL